MVQDGRDGTIWVKEGPGRISGAAEGPLSDLTFAAKDLYDVSSFMHAVYDHRTACQPQASQTCKASLKHEDVHAQSSLADGHGLLGYADSGVCHRLWAALLERDTSTSKGHSTRCQGKAHL